MFDGGGVPIDHYIIQLDNGTQLETPGPTYSFDIMYNTTLSVNISAHNCAGYSDPFPLDIQYDPGSLNYPSVVQEITVIPTGTMSPTLTTFPSYSHSLIPLLAISVPTTGVSFSYHNCAISVIVALLHKIS